MSYSRDLDNFFLYIAAVHVYLSLLAVHVCPCNHVCPQFFYVNPRYTYQRVYTLLDLLTWYLQQVLYIARYNTG